MSATALLNPTRYTVLSFAAQGPSRARPSVPSGLRAFSGTPERTKALPFTLNASATPTVHAEPVEGGMLRMVMFGKPGAGKGTLSERLVKKFDIVSISTGDLLRQHIAQKTEIGRQAEEIVARGDLLPDELMLRIITSKLGHLHDKHWILDGFPRTIGQGELLDTHLRAQCTPLTLLVTLTVPTHILHARIAGRFVHPASGRVYNTHFNPPRVTGLDDLTGESLIQRPDDRPEVYNRRLAAYERATAPLLGYYSRRVEEEEESATMRGAGIGMRIVSLAGETSDEMWPTLESTVRDLFPGVKEKAPSPRQTDVPPQQSREAVAILSAAAEGKKSVGEAAAEAVTGGLADKRD